MLLHLMTLDFRHYLLSEPLSFTFVLILFRHIIVVMRLTSSPLVNLDMFNINVFRGAGPQHAVLVLSLDFVLIRLKKQIHKDKINVFGLSLF